MPGLDFKELTDNMLEAAAASFKKDWASISKDAEKEFQVLAKCILEIEKNKLAGKIIEDDARDLIDMQKNAMKTKLLKIEGLQILACENALNAALGVVRVTVNKAIGWDIL